jgi:MoaA/NifB/PqqE/SkfB family radical SAM enzyme
MFVGMLVSAPSSSIAFDGRVPFPNFASIETTMKCNLQCPMCLPFADGSTVAGSHMEADAFERVARALFPHLDRFQLTVTGEPLMSKGLGRILDLAQEYGVRAEYYTNGTLLKERMIALILPSLGEICFSIDGATKETFETLRAGASFEAVFRNVELLMAAIREIPERERPVVGFNVTIMKRNVRELPAIVELAHALGIDYVTAGHVFPGVPEMQPESLAHDVPLAIEWTGKALEVGQKLGIPVCILPLDEMTAEMARAGGVSGVKQRLIATRDGVVAGLERRAVNGERRRYPPPPRISSEATRKHVAARSELRAREAALGSAPGSSGPMPDEIWFCDFLWNRTYVTTDGFIRPCCVPGVPAVGDLRETSWEDVWDGEAYRAMRMALVHREPLPVCRGCQYVRKVTDEKEIRRILRGRPPLAAAEPEEVAVYGTAEAPFTYESPPTFVWPAKDADGYEFEAVTIDQSRLRYDTASLGIELREPRITIPSWIWDDTPPGVPIEWRASARLFREPVVVARGCLVRRSNPST